MTDKNRKSSKRVAILGANGRLSREVARAFHSAGWIVRAVTRDGKSRPLENLSGMEFAAADAMNREQIVRATTGCDIIFNGLNPVYTQWAEKCMVMAENVMAATRENHARHLFAGNIYNFGSKMPEVLTPETVFRPDHRKAHIRTQMEELFQVTAKAEGIQTINLRAGDFYGGDGTGSWFDLGVLSKLAKGKVIYPGNRNIVHAWAYLPDLAKAFVALGEKADELESFEVFHFEGHNITGDALHKAIEMVTEKSLKPAGLPGILLKIAGMFSPQMREVSQMYYLWQTPHQMKDNRLCDVIGTLPHTPLVEAVRGAMIDQGHKVETGEIAARQLGKFKLA